MSEILYAILGDQDPLLFYSSVCAAVDINSLGRS